jgi:glycosyltransferase involved in cell wall biosynthesis
METIKSVTSQTYTDWQMFVVNDSPTNVLYAKVEAEIRNNPKIVYIKNNENRGVNFSRNAALDAINKRSTAGDWVIFLDDDDSLSKDALETFVKINKEHPEEEWLVTNLASYDGVSFTKIPQTDKRYSYKFGFLLTKRLKGDVTHCISVRAIDGTRFSKLVKQGEEWLFFYELSLHVNKFLYTDHNSKLTSGYSPDGLNFRKRTKKDRLSDLFLLIEESCSRGIIWHPTLLFYFFARIILVIFK